MFIGARHGGAGLDRLPPADFLSAVKEMQPELREGDAPDRIRSRAPHVPPPRVAASKAITLLPARATIIGALQCESAHCTGDELLLFQMA